MSKSISKPCSVKLPSDEALEEGVNFRRMDLIKTKVEFCFWRH